MRVLIISGGGSSERKISLMSAKEVKKALEQSDIKVVMFDLRKGIDKLKESAKKVDVIFPVLHGEEGEGGELQRLLKIFKRPVVGGDADGFKQGWFKISCKQYCEINNIPTAEWKELIRGDGELMDQIKQFGFPSVLKSDNGGSSREVVILKKEDDLQGKGVKQLVNSKDRLFVERFLPGVEITVGVLNNRALPVVEIIPPEGGWFDYENKYWGETKEIPFAPSVEKRVQQEAQNIAERVHQDLKLGSISRIDFIIHENKPYLLEINTIPGMTASSLFPKAAKAIGMDFPALTKHLVETAIL